MTRPTDSSVSLLGVCMTCSLPPFRIRAIARIGCRVDALGCDGKRRIRPRPRGAEDSRLFLFRTRKHKGNTGVVALAVEAGLQQRAETLDVGVRPDVGIHAVQQAVGNAAVRGPALDLSDLNAAVTLAHFAADAEAEAASQPAAHVQRRGLVEVARQHAALYARCRRRALQRPE